MKKIIIITLCTLIGASAWAQKPAKKQPARPSGKTQISLPMQFGFYKINVVPVSSDTPGLPYQSFISASSGNNILIVGGRTNGFHGTDATDSSINFPAYYSNTNFVVYNPTNGSIKTAPIPAAYLDQLSSTNMLGCQNGDTLYGCGGYGKNSAGNYVTYNGFFAISVSQMINAILSGSTSNLSQYIVSTSNNYMAVTGGELQKMGNYFYVVMGQNFTGLYAPPPQQNSVQIYTNAIRKFTVTNTGSSLSAMLVDSFTDGNRPDSTSRFHRRDLNVVPIINTDKTPGMAVYGGVFTQKVNGVWVNPVYITQGANNSTNVTIDNSFIQKFNQYGCAQVLCYEPNTNTMVTNLMGGISYYTYSSNGVLVPDAAVPFSKTISTIFRNSFGTLETYTAFNSGLPDYIGSESKFFPLQNLLYGGSGEIIDLSKVPLNGKPTFVGYMFGGIMATSAQSSTINPTMASKKLYRVYITRSIIYPAKKTAK